ncbi:ribonuclease H-like domain-containing protein [Savagea faecisuis]|uniref:Ribonuclease H-like domain-containing protein n=1 Tax=Savagea faecisuis TaxID=1274803 RepID=A0ABW3GTZ9_9BACL
MSYESRLLEMRRKLVKKKKVESVEKSKPVAIPAPPYEQNWLRAGLQKVENEHGIVYLKEKRYALDAMHGNRTFRSLFQALEQWEHVEEDHPLKSGAQERLVFFDTETTGLAGAGAYIFLHGLFEREEEHLVLRQYVLPSPDHEAAFLYASRFYERGVTLVTYNGKSFDVPMVESRWTLHRQQLPPLQKQKQIDLLHAARRIWKDEQTSFSLVQMEETILNFFREDDIPGHLAPIIYEDAVRSGEPQALMDILRHNEWDLLSLVTFYGEAVETVLRQKETSSTVEVNVAKWLNDLKLFGQSRQQFEQIVDTYGAETPTAHYYLGKLLKKEGRPLEAFVFFEQSTHVRNRIGIEATIQCAMIAEHHKKEYVLALRYTTKAYEQLMSDETEITQRFRENTAQQLHARKARLMKKIKRQQSEKSDG